MYRKQELANGVRVVTEEIPSVHSAAVGIWIGCGSRDESEQQLGLSHFLEHMFFKGTKNRTAKQIAEQLDAVGGHLNAFTTKEYTCLYAKVVAEHLGLAIEVLSDMYFNSLFAELDLAKEKKVVLEEIKMYEDSPDELVHDLFSETVWQDHPLGRPILGSAESVSSLGKDQVIEYLYKQYVPENTVLAVAGNIKHHEVVNRLDDVFGQFRRNGGKRLMSPAVFQARSRNFAKDTEQLQICLGVPGLSQDDKDIYALYALNNMLGGGLSSRLFQEIREERGLAYSIYSYHTSYSDTGLFTIYAGTSPENYQELIEVILKEIYSFKNKGVTEVELQRTKDQIKGNLLLGMENVSSRMSRLGKTELSFDRVVTAEEIVKEINTVTRQDIHMVAERLFNRASFSSTTIGQTNNELLWPQLLANSGL
ncbi:insulinase family protein [Metallumcola ferriviriculae]|uniref:Insulinase family protein n=1 Tax=Metallumcola ferriviriculae TaxID=3039180 RepID=A0AAU0UNE7_9FIRM|nr:insulinase family protein [Desulfitibacteraceae bacterium MK1]